MKTLKFLAMAALLSPLGALVADAGKVPDNPLAEIAGYRQWTRVNRQPVQVNVPAISLAPNTVDFGTIAI